MTDEEKVKELETKLDSALKELRRKAGQATGPTGPTGAKGATGPKGATGDVVVTKAWLDLNSPKNFTSGKRNMRVASPSFSAFKPAATGFSASGSVCSVNATGVSMTFCGLMITLGGADRTITHLMTVMSAASFPTAMATYFLGGKFASATAAKSRAAAFSNESGVLDDEIAALEKALFANEVEKL